MNKIGFRFRSDFNNGDDYLALSGQSLRVPAEPADVPHAEFLEWHNKIKFRSAA